MATPKSAELAVNLMNRTGRLRKKAAEALGRTDPGDVSSQEITEYRTYILQELIQADQSTVSDFITTLNRELGFDKQLDTATSRQRLYIVDLENGLALDRTRPDCPMTYAEADARIKMLKSVLDQDQARKLARAHLRRVK